MREPTAAYLSVSFLWAHTNRKGDLKQTPQQTEQIDAVAGVEKESDSEMMHTQPQKYLPHKDLS